METTVPTLDLSTVDQHLADMQAARDYVAEHLAHIPFVTTSMSSGCLSLQVSQFDKDAGRMMQEAARILAAGQPVGAVRKNYTDNSASVRRPFGSASVKVFLARSAACEAKVVGTEKIMVPDPDAPLIEVERDIVEWDCRPILSSDEVGA